MSKAVKALVTDELRDRYAGVDSVCVVDLTGLNVAQQEQLRGMVRDKQGRMQVVKNSLVRRAFQDGPLDPLGKVLEGPCALVTSAESLIDIAKTLVQAAKEFDQLKLKQAMLAGDPELLTVAALSKMKSRIELLGEVAMLVTSPAAALAGCVGGPQARLAGCIKAIAEKAA